MTERNQQEQNATQRQVELLSAALTRAKENGGLFLNPQGKKAPALYPKLLPASPFNALSLRQTLSLDFPIRKTTVRISYIGDFQQANVNHLKSHVWSNAFMIGYVKSIQLP